MSPLPFRAVALDMDGTLLDPSGRVTPAAAAAIRALAERGVRVVLASGRMTARVAPFIRELGLRLDLIAYNGAEVCAHGPDGWTPILARTLSAEARDAVFDLCRRHARFLNVYAGGKLHGYHPGGDYSHSLHYEAQTLAVYASKVDSLEALPREAILKLLVIDTPENRERLHREWEPLVAAHCQVLKSNPEYLEFVDLGTTKGSALAFWLARNGLRPDEMVALGDAENDLEMLRMAGLGIAMANATPGLKAAFPRISPWSHAEDGVARELARIFSL